MKFTLTYTVHTPSSIEVGGSQWNGFLPSSGEIPHRNNFVTRPAEFTLRECVELMVALKGYQPPQASEYPRKGFRWFSVTDWEGCESDYQKELSMHFPDHISDATRERIFQLVEQG